MKLIIIAAALVTTGCAIAPDRYPITTEKREFTYDYVVPGKTQADLFRSARNYMAVAYGDSRAVTRSEDEAQGTIIGKAIMPWNLSTDSPMIPHLKCTSNYDITFIAKDGKARLHMALLEGVPPSSTCSGWPLPPKRDYQQIVNAFDNSAKALESALNGNSAIDRLKNF